MIGRTLSHYRVLEKIGSGGMGEVYVAEDTRLERKVALKLLPEEVAGDPERLRRFEHEAKVLAGLNHPNIVTVHSVEEVDGLHFLTMELVEGSSLADLIPEGGFPLERFFEIAVPLLDALTEAHARGVIHRDLKPGNVMVSDSGQVKVLDFGLAKLRASQHVADATQLPTEPLTAEGLIVGTLPYMSPEQLENRPLDARSDIFSLGVVLYEMAVGNRPFGGASSVSLISSIVKDVPPDVDTLRRDLPHHLGRIIRHCLEKAPEDRFQTARDVRNQLADLEREASSSTVRIPGPARPDAGARRHRPLAALTLGVALLGGGYLAWRALAPPESAGVATPEAVAQPKIVVLPFENLGAPEDEYFTDGMHEEITSRLASMAGLSVISRTTAMQYKSERPSIQGLAEDLGVDYVLEGTVRWQRAAEGASRIRVTPQLIRASDDIHVWTERYDAVLADIFEVQSDIARRVSEELDVTLLDSQTATFDSRPTEDLEAYDVYLRANELLDRGRELTSSDDTRQAIERYEEAIARDSDFALAHARLGWAHLDLYAGYSDHTDERLGAARSAIQKALAIDPELVDANLALGRYHMAGAKDYERALAAFREVQRRQPNHGAVHELMAVAQEETGDWEASLASLRKAWELNPRLGRLPCSAGGACIAMRDFAEAVEFHEHAIRLTPDRSCPYFCVGWIYLDWDGDTARARALLDELPTHVDREATPPINFISFLAELFDRRWEEALDVLGSGSAEAYEFHFFYYPKALLRAQVHGLAGRKDLERIHYEAAYQLLLARSRDRPDDDRVRASLGVALAGLERPEEAIREAERALELIGDTHHKRLGFRIRDLAATYTMVGETELAIEQLERLLSIPSFISAAMVRVDPAWDPLRGHPRFEALLAKHSPASRAA